jgi:hypothetical protein
MVARKKQLYNRRIEKKRATNNFLQRPASFNYQKSEFMALFHKQNSAGKKTLVRRVAQRGEGLCV